MIAESSSSSNKRAIVWFRKDLRLADHPALDAALQGGMEIIPVFIWDKEEGGAWSPGAASRWWLHHALADLDQSIRAQGSKLVLSAGHAVEELPKIAQAHQADIILYGRCYDCLLYTSDAADE